MRNRFGKLGLIALVIASIVLISYSGCGKKSKGKSASPVIAGSSVATNFWTEKIADSAVITPTRRLYHKMVWDAAGQKGILVGGFDGSYYLNDLYWYEPISNTWTEKLPDNQSGTPTGRYDYSIVWDPIRANVIMFGGSDGTKMNDLWWYNPVSNTWTEKIALNQPGSPASRTAHSMVWNGIDVIMFGGSDDSYTLKNDLWWYNPVSNTWTEKIAINAIGSPASRTGHAMVWTGTDVIMFGGWNAVSSYLNDIWSYNPISNTWTEKISLNTFGSPITRTNCTMNWIGTKAVMFGGSGSGSNYRNDLWDYNPASNIWAERIAQSSPGSPPVRSYHQMIWDSLGQRLIMFGGYNGSSRLNDLWWYNP